MEVSSRAAYVQPAAYPHAGPLRLKSDVYADFSAAGDDGVCVCVCVGGERSLPVRVCLGLEPEEDEWTRFYLRV